MQLTERLSWNQIASDGWPSIDEMPCEGRAQDSTRAALSRQ
jgi:hypothetical protein